MTDQKATEALEQLTEYIRVKAQYYGTYYNQYGHEADNTRHIILSGILADYEQGRTKLITERLKEFNNTHKK